MRKLVAGLTMLISLVSSLSYGYDPDREPSSQVNGSTGGGESSEEVYTKAYRDKINPPAGTEENIQHQKNHKKYLRTIERFDNFDKRAK